MTFPLPTSLSANCFPSKFYEKIRPSDINSYDFLSTSAPVEEVAFSPKTTPTFYYLCEWQRENTGGLSCWRTVPYALSFPCKVHLLCRLCHPTHAPLKRKASCSWLAQKYFLCLKLKDVTLFIVKRDLYIKVGVWMRFIVGAYFH